MTTKILTTIEYSPKPVPTAVLVELFNGGKSNYGSGVWSALLRLQEAGLVRKIKGANRRSSWGKAIDARVNAE